MTFLETLMIAVIPALLSSIVTFLIASKNIKSSIKTVEENNKHEIEKLGEQHKLDLESIAQKHTLEMESMEKDHNNKLEILQKEFENELVKNSKTKEEGVMYDVMGDLFKDIIKNPSKLRDLQKLSDELKKK